MNHGEEVERWVEENVLSFPTPEVVTLRSFDIDWTAVSGSFSVVLDDEEIPHPFTLSLGMTDRISVEPPYFTSPLGAPCSYCAVELTDDTWNTIDKIMKKCFPRFQPYGRDRETGIFICSSTPLSKRIIDSSEFQRAQAKINRDFSISIKVKDDQ